MKKSAAAAPPTFDVGERVTYYPVKTSRDDNRHWPAEVLARQLSGRYLVEVIAPPPYGRPADRHGAPARQAR